MKVQWEDRGVTFEAEVPDDAVPFHLHSHCPCHPGEGHVRLIDHEDGDYLCTVDGGWSEESPVWRPVPPVYYSTVGDRISIYGIRGKAVT